MYIYTISDPCQLQLERKEPLLSHLSTVGLGVLGQCLHQQDFSKTTTPMPEGAATMFGEDRSKHLPIRSSCT